MYNVNKRSKIYLTPLQRHGSDVFMVSCCSFHLLKTKKPFADALFIFTKSSGACVCAPIQ